MSDSAGLAQKVIPATISGKTEQNSIDLLLSAIKGIQDSCIHEPGYLARDLVLESSKKEGIFLAETNLGSLRTFRAICKKCNKEIRYFVGHICPVCLVAMEKIKGPCEIGMFNRCEYLPGRPDPNLSDPFFSVIMNKCPKCGLTVVWDKYTCTFDYQQPAYKSG
jgi:hypothetical protein